MQKTSNTIKSLISSIYLPLQMLNLFQPTTDILNKFVQKENSSAQNNQKSVRLQTNMIVTLLFILKKILVQNLVNQSHVMIVMFFL